MTLSVENSKTNGNGAKAAVNSFFHKIYSKIYVPLNMLFESTFEWRTETNFHKSLLYQLSQFLNIRGKLQFTFLLFSLR